MGACNHFKSNDRRISNGFGIRLQCESRRKNTSRADYIIGIIPIIIVNINNLVINRLSDKLLYQIKEDLAVVKVKIESELGEEGRLNVAISDFKRTTDDLRSDVSDIKFDLSPIKTTVTNVLKSFYWALRIVGGALILWMVAHYMELNDLDNVNNKQRMDNMEIPE